MNSDIKAKWLAALRSGEFKQGTSYLRDAAGHYCCLGVLCEVYRQEFPKILWDGIYFLDYSTALPIEVTQWAGLASNNPIIPSCHQSLAHLNDVEKFNFNEIADLIEKEL